MFPRERATGADRKNPAVRLFVDRARRAEARTLVEEQVQPLAGRKLPARVLLFQALLLAHGGITTLGANAFSMAIVGPWVAWGVWRLTSGFGRSVSVFLAAALGNLATYCVTSVQLALAFPDPAAAR